MDYCHPLVFISVILADEAIKWHKKRQRYYFKCPKRPKRIVTTGTPVTYSVYIYNIYICSIYNTHKNSLKNNIYVQQVRCIVLSYIQYTICVLQTKLLLCVKGRANMD